ncbi:MAG: FAD-dependent monooxygenase [Pseudomonadota bacterium]
MTQSKYDVIVTGSGLAGLAAAALLSAADESLTIAVIDPTVLPLEPDPVRAGQRVSALTPASVKRFDALGLWASMPQTHIAPFTAMRVWDAAVACGEGVCFSANEAGLSELGTITDNLMLRWQLYQYLLARPAVALIDAAMTDCNASREQVVVQTDGTDEIAAKLLVGADGRNSVVRRHAGIGIKTIDHQQIAVVTQLDTELAHYDTAFQRFLPEGPLALLPLSDGRVSLVWTTSPTRADEILAMDDKAFGAAVTDASDHVLGSLAPSLKRVSFPLISQFAPDPIATRTVLLGDAAHAIHPLAGQGINLGFSDAAVLADIAKDARGADLGDAPWLRRYRRRRIADNVSTLYGLDLLNRLFAREQGAVADLRRRGMRWFDRAGPLKRLASGHAMGNPLGLLIARDGVS